MKYPIEIINKRKQKMSVDEKGHKIKILRILELWPLTEYSK